MKHTDFERSERVEDTGDSADLRRCLWLTHMKSSTRSSTLDSLATLCTASRVDGELPITAIRQLICEPDPEVKAEVGARWAQVASDVRRALRGWEDAPIRWLALRLRGRIPTFADAATAASLRLGADEAKRATAALEALANSDGAAIDEMPATLGAVEPLLRRATPETFRVASMKSLENKRTLIRKVVRLVDPLKTGQRVTSVEALPAEWRETLSVINGFLKDHETSHAAILRRLASFCAQQNTSPSEINEALIDAFVDIELSTHASKYVEKVRAAFRKWNASVEAGHDVPLLILPGARMYRQPDVDWASVPSEIRLPVDAYLATAVSVRNAGDWGNFVPDIDPEYAELGVAFVETTSEENADAAPILELGTRKNWRDTVKRAWYAASIDHRVQPKPATLNDLFCQPVISALVAATRKHRRERLEAAGGVFDPKVKGSYEHTLVEALYAVGCALSVPDELLEQVKEFKLQIDPNVIQTKRNQDGSLTRVYAERRIGVRHANMLAKFGDLTRLKRWFEAPSTMWRLACRPIQAGKKPQLTHVAMARSALIARIGQYVAPIRRTNHARLRHTGDDRHIMLPEGDGEGTLIIPPQEGKVLREVHVRIDRETVRMLKYYIKHFLPVAQKHAKASAANPHLYPGADGVRVEDGGYAPGYGYLTKTKLNSTFKNHMMKYCGLDLCLHVLRHLAGKIILDQDPSAMSLVQEILGHLRIKTTQSYYAEVSKIVAQRRYIHLLERQARQVLATVTFKFVDPQTGKEI